MRLKATPHLRMLFLNWRIDMFKALLKKQLLEINKGYYTDKKTGVRKSTKATISYVLLFVGILAIIGFAFAMLCTPLITSFHPVGLDWLYFSITATLSVMLGTFGSVFNTYSVLYKAEDNELLLSLPIKPFYIVSAKLIGVFLTGLMYELPAIIPAIIVYWKYAGATISAAIQIISIFIIALLILSISCVLGYIVAVISTKIKSKAFISAIASVLFLVLYYVVYFKINTLIRTIVENADAVGKKIKSSTFLLYHLGNGINGDIKSFLIISGIIIAFALIVFAVLEKNFVKLASMSQAHSRGKIKSRVTEAKKPKSALLKKELKRFSTSTIYMVNCGLGVIIMPLLAIFSAVKSNLVLTTINEISVDMPNIKGALPMIITAMICVICSMNAVTAPAVSLEGKNLWVTQSLPVDTALILEAKENLGVTINGVPALVSTLIMCVAFRLEVLSVILCLSTVWLFIWFTAKTGLAMNLKFPNLTWTNEVVPVKQSLSLMLTLLIGFLASMCMLLPSFAAVSVMSINTFMIAVIVVLILTNIILHNWIKNKGTKIFENL